MTSIDYKHVKALRLLYKKKELDKKLIGKLYSTDRMLIGDYLQDEGFTLIQIEARRIEKGDWIDKLFVQVEEDVNWSFEVSASGANKDSVTTRGRKPNGGFLPLKYKPEERVQVYRR